VHHLYPRVHHRHYRPLSDQLAGVCEAHGETYRVHGTLFAALRSHFRWLKRMGAAPAVALAS
jgi:linoleoyl-CoA desaturase